MIKSLRWRLQLWHALLLTTVLVIFGGVVYALQWQTRLQQTDAELDRMASVLTSRLRGLFPVPRMPQPPSRARPPGRGPADELAAADALQPENVSRGRGRRDRGAPEAGRESDPPASRETQRPADPERETPPQQSTAGLGNRETSGREAAPDRERNRDPERDADRNREPDRTREQDRNRDLARNPWFAPPPGLGLPDEFKHLFEGTSPGTFYFAIWDRSGTLLEKSSSVGEVPFPDLHIAEDGLPVRRVFQRGLDREVVHVSRFDINVLVGRSIEPDLMSLHRSGLMLILTGLGVLVIGLAGGWWFTSRALRPIAEISAIAQSISVRNLSNRINVQSTATELEQLATVLNHTFDRLQSAIVRQGQFTADASHELRTPLSVILTHAELALARPRAAEDYQKAFQACRRASLRMKSLIDSLLLLARFDSPETAPVRKPIELNRVVQDAVEMLQPLAEERQVTLRCHGVPVTVDADQEQILQLITNLVTNAIRYNRPGGTVDVQILPEGDVVRIRVQDTGVGIPADDLPRIFNRFYRVDKARSHAEGGCGLGLAICQNIVEAHGGTISATSIFGEGATVEVRLPARAHDEIGRAAVSDSPSAEALTALHS